MGTRFSFLCEFGVKFGALCVLISGVLFVHLEFQYQHRVRKIGIELKFSILKFRGGLEPV